MLGVVILNAILLIVVEPFQIITILKGFESLANVVEVLLKHSKFSTFVAENFETGTKS